MTREEVTAIKDAFIPELTQMEERIERKMDERLKAQEERLIKVIIQNSKALGKLIAHTVGALADALDTTYASKETEKLIEHLRKHLQATP